MRYFEMVEPSNEPVGYDIPVWNILSEDEIINSAYGDHCCLMYLTRLGYLPTREQIIEDWSIVHWAGELK